MKKILTLFLFSTVLSSVSLSAFGIKIKVVNNTSKNWSVRIYDSGLRSISTNKNDMGWKLINKLRPGEVLISKETTPRSTIQITSNGGRSTAVGGGRKITLRKDISSDKDTTVKIKSLRRRCTQKINAKPKQERKNGAGNTCFYVEEEKEPIVQL